ncbi:putative ribulose-phosphate 3-epimerase [Leptomonas pyrrhocoris]|uniref:ribulose-phosphate 3-epimerase n=1 Tax=Leptomonas pyrrhocoris TaxID=157538 RepID=A0A0M9GB34_LEPPY|nr:putative ribulose-phosphate 3-epimerase [Leptomonas pyrrhocoris]XP_015664875.1 putative ribulose-phosphate 3-epimerase [Leptomonas pyrrhocoris]KPA86435.1 putative ribulose-phosphate 3-epimerase [Leptomonas pyrrhocoris]KPA86436.1 putative ribulose-phosphate 3-epimerase [Leptomonas pyrrhocoris]|eukprot:XP_015664874.1 putative ribulose-phosphate 3-epimerase [Leptomonas pyrrhocoris]
MFDHQNKKTFLNGRNKKQPIVPIISPSLMVADQTRLLEETLHVLSPEGGSVEWIHVDIVDGHFAPNFSFCPKTVSDLRHHLPHAFLDVHFIANNPSMWVEPFAKAGASNFAFHVETTEDPIGVCRQIHQAGIMAGVALCVDTPVEALFPVLDSGEADVALVMMVKSGFAGQNFQPDAVEKVRVLRKRYPHLTIQVDGSITLETINLCAEAGANAIVPGRAVYKAKNRRESVLKLRSTIQKYINQRAQSHL